MNITYYGHSCLLLSHNGVQVIIDPFLSGNPASKISPADLKVDAVIVTHGHGDHFGDALELARSNTCPVIAVNELAHYCRSKGAEVHGLNFGGTVRLPGLSVKLTPAVHSNSLHDDDGTMRFVGDPAGVLVTMGDKTLYHAGDTALFGDMQLIGRLNKIDAAALPIGDYYTMGPEEALLAAEWTQANVIIPLHYNTFPVIRQDAAAFAAACRDKGICCEPLQNGEAVQL